MTNKERRQKIKELKEEYNRRVDEINVKFITQEAEFSVGDFVRNVTGVIKIDKVSYHYSGGLGDISLQYIGLPYWYKEKGKLSRTDSKDNKIIRHDFKAVNPNHLP